MDNPIPGILDWFLRGWQKKNTQLNKTKGSLHHIHHMLPVYSCTEYRNRWYPSEALMGMVRMWPRCCWPGYRYHMYIWCHLYALYGTWCSALVKILYVTVLNKFKWEMSLNLFWFEPLTYIRVHVGSGYNGDSSCAGL